MPSQGSKPDRPSNRTQVASIETILRSRFAGRWRMAICPDRIILLDIARLPPLPKTSAIDKYAAGRHTAPISHLECLSSQIWPNREP